MNVDRPRGSMQLSRREVLAAGATVLASPGCVRAATSGAEPTAPLRLPSGPPMPIALAGGPRGAAPESVAQAVRVAACGPDDLAWLSRGDSVFIKVAANSGNPYPATTDPIAVRAMVELLRARGAGRVIVAAMCGVQVVRFWKDGLRGSSRTLMKQNGIARAADEAGAELHAFEEARWDGFFDERPTVTGSWTGPIMLPAILREVDHVVLMPRCSRHVLAGSKLPLQHDRR